MGKPGRVMGRRITKIIGKKEKRMSRYCIFTQEQAEKALAQWQQTLRLNDWEVWVKIVRARDMVMDPPGEAEVTWLEEKKMAIIRLLDPIDFEPDTLYPQNHELNIIHELLHLHMVPFSADDNTAASVAQEQMIHILSIALLEMRYGNPEYCRIKLDIDTEVGASE